MVEKGILVGTNYDCSTKLCRIPKLSGWSFEDYVNLVREIEEVITEYDPEYGNREDEKGVLVDAKDPEEGWDFSGGSKALFHWLIENQQHDTFVYDEETGQEVSVWNGDEVICNDDGEPIDGIGLYDGMKIDEVSFSE